MPLDLSPSASYFVSFAIVFMCIVRIYSVYVLYMVLRMFMCFVFDICISCLCIYVCMYVCMYACISYVYKI